MSRHQHFPLGFVWQTFDPFLFCVHHDDAYPNGNEAMGPDASLAGRNLGMDFEVKDGFRMYHGDVVPGFPRHPHRGFETVTLVRRGLIDHSDSMGAAARFGGGDCQWMTAGGGVVHSEMFPLVHRDRPNPVELFQLWLNLPPEDKMVPAHFTMLWGDDIPQVALRDAEGRGVRVTVVAGALGDARPPAPPPKSWASRPEAGLAIWVVRLDPGAQWTLPAVPGGVHRTLYVFDGAAAVDGVVAGAPTGVRLATTGEVALRGGEAGAELVLLQARPIGAPVAQHGPFVMNTRAEIMAAFEDYRRTGFGGWPWASDAPVHPREQGRFARLPDGTVVSPPG